MTTLLCEKATRDGERSRQEQRNGRELNRKKGSEAERWVSAHKHNKRQFGSTGNDAYNFARKRDGAFHMIDSTLLACQICPRLG